MAPKSNKKRPREEEAVNKKDQTPSPPPPSEEASAVVAASPLTRRSSSLSTAVTAEQILVGTVPFVRRTKDSDFKPSTMWKVVSWNVAGLRALLKKEKNPLQSFVAKEQPDLLCLQETKLSDLTEAKTTGVLPGYTFVDSISTAKKGYSGTRTYIKDEMLPFVVKHSFALDPSKPDSVDDEGRVLSTFIESKADGVRWVLVNMYVPNAGMKLERLEYRTQTYDVAVRTLLASLQQTDPNNKKKQEEATTAAFPVVWVGDLNVAERDYDRYFATNFKAMQKVPGFTPEERASFRKTLEDASLVDSFRHLYPNASGAYTFFSAKFNARALGNGWRLDYAVVSKALTERVVDSYMLPEVEGSDHCPVVLWLKR